MAENAMIDKNATTHVLRHAFATQRLEGGIGGRVNIEH